MPKIALKTNVIIEKDLVENAKYKIVGVEEFVSPENQKGIKVKCKSLNENDKDKYATILWVRDNVGINSKLGAFIVALSEIDNDGKPIVTDAQTWVNRDIIVKSWKDKEREILSIN